MFIKFSKLEIGYTCIFKWIDKGKYCRIFISLNTHLCENPSYHPKYLSQSKLYAVTCPTLWICDKIYNIPIKIIALAGWRMSLAYTCWIYWGVKAVTSLCHLADCQEHLSLGFRTTQVIFWKLVDFYGFGSLVMESYAWDLGAYMYVSLLNVLMILSDSLLLTFYFCQNWHYSSSYF